MGELRRADAVHSRGALWRYRGDAPAAPARRRSEHRDDAGIDGADGGVGNQLDPGADVHAVRSGLRCRREALSREGRAGECDQLAAAGRHSRRRESWLDVDHSAPRRRRCQARCGGCRRPHAVGVCQRHVPRDSSAGGQTRSDRAAEEAGREMNRLLLASAFAFFAAFWASAHVEAGLPQTAPAGTDAVAGVSRTYCQTCHNDRLKTGGLSLEGLTVDRDAETWEKVIRKVRAGMMPPAGAKRPDRAALDAFAGSIENAIDRAAAANP